jgi:molybdopterin-guanine dinucleotide biosynthesis protein A
VCRIVSEVVSPVVVVAAQSQELPELASTVRVIRDEYDSLGPLAGIATGLGAIRDEVDAAFVTSVDAPLLRSSFVTRLVEKLSNHDAVVPADDEFAHVLSGVYRTSLEDLARRLLGEQRRRPLFLIEESDSQRIHVDELRCIDPELESLRNMNTIDDYEEVLELLRIRNDISE